MDLVGNSKDYVLMYIILESDVALLFENLENSEGRVRELLEVVRNSLTQSSETFHDNFDFDDGNRQLAIHESELYGLRRVVENLQVKKPGDGTLPELGSAFDVVFDDDHEVFSLTIGGTYVPCGSSNISYNSPLAQALIIAKVGDSTCLLGGSVRVRVVAKK